MVDTAPWPLSTINRVFNPPPLVTVLRLSGTIGRMGPRRAAIGLHELDDAIGRAFRPRRLAAVALAVNSPGGSAAQSALIAKRIRAEAEERNVKVIAFCEDVAASGGYWLATAADEIVADPTSIIGSIGVISGGFGFVDLLDKIGVERRMHTAGKRKGMLDPFAPEKRDDVRHLTRMQKDIHRDFQDWVRTRRGERLKGDEQDLFSGAVWTGRMALELGLVDELGGLHTVLRERYGRDVRLRTINAQRPLLKRLFGLGGRAPASAVDETLPTQALDTIEDRLMWNRYGL